MSKTVTLADVMLALEGMGVTGDPRTIAEVRIEPRGIQRGDVGWIRILRYHAPEGKIWAEENGRPVMTREDIRIVQHRAHEDPPPCATCKGTGAVEVEPYGDGPCPHCCKAADPVTTQQ